MCCDLPKIIQVIARIFKKSEKKPTLRALFPPSFNHIGKGILFIFIHRRVQAFYESVHGKASEKFESTSLLLHLA
jgi:hypothetical protein